MAKIDFSQNMVERAKARGTVWFLGAFVALGPAVAYGKDCKGVTFPEQTQLDGAALTLNGLGLYRATFLKVEAYVAALYVPKASKEPNALLQSNSPYVVILQVLRNVGAGDITKGWDDGFEENSKAELPALKERIAVLNNWMTDMKTGQRMTFSFSPGVGLLVNVNGAAKGTIKGDDFGKAFLSILLGANPPGPGLKAGLLGGACG